MCMRVGVCMPLKFKEERQVSIVYEDIANMILQLDHRFVTSMI